MEIATQEEIGATKTRRDGEKERKEKRYRDEKRQKQKTKRDIPRYNRESGKGKKLSEIELNRRRK